MRIQVLIPDQLEKPMGGMGEQARNILNAFSSPDYQFDVIGSSGQEQSVGDIVSYYPVNELRVPIGKNEPLSNTFLNQSLFVSKSKDLEEPDVIHAFDWSTFYAGCLLSREYQVPLVVTIQLSIEKMMHTAIDPMQKLSYDVACGIELMGMLNASRIIHMTETYARKFSKLFLLKTSIVPNGINNREWQTHSNYKLPGTRKIKLVYIGRYAFMKNIQTLVQCQIPDDIDLIFIGSNRGGDASLFDAMRKRTQADNVHYIGALYGQEKIDAMCSADAVIVPSIHEPFGIVALEALASRSVLLSSFIDGMGDFLTLEIAVNCGTTKDSIELAMQKLVNMQPRERQYRIENGLKLCETMDWSIQAEKLAKVYDSVLKPEEIKAANG